MILTSSKLMGTVVGSRWQMQALKDGKMTCVLKVSRRVCSVFCPAVTRICEAGRLGSRLSRGGYSTWLCILV